MPTNWIPLESNPDVLNEYLEKLGCQTSICFQDVYGLDPDLLAMIPPPIKALILLFPITSKYEEYRKILNIESKNRPQSTLFFTQQTIGNACGTIGLIHALANCLDSTEMGNGIFKETVTELQPLDPSLRANALEKSEKFAKVHESAAVQGQTEAPDADSEVDLHFVCFVEKDAHLYELDGRNESPINHGSIEEGSSFALKAAQTIRKVMDLTPDENNFTILAFAGPP